MAENDPPIGRVNVIYHGPDDVRLEPHLGVINRIHQTITWHLINRSSDNVSFRAENGIFFPWPITAPPPPPDVPVYSKWPGQTPTGDATVYTANAMSPVTGNQSQFYLYYIALETSSGQIIIKKGKNPTTLELIDPPVENEPKP